jgi:hypothetical protein
MELQGQRRPHFGGDGATSSWKRGSFRSGSNIGSSRSRAGVSGAAVSVSTGIDSSFRKAAMARSGSPICAATAARTWIGAGPLTASFSIGFAAIARSARANAAALLPRPIFVSARAPSRLKFLAVPRGTIPVRRVPVANFSAQRHGRQQLLAPSLTKSAGRR